MAIDKCIMKDFFSTQSELYATYRPVYPDALYQFIYAHLHSSDAAWDCATGNGQVARELAKHFQKVYATDISEKQLAHAAYADNIVYSISRAEKTNFNDNQFDLITVGQALHWFHVDEFYKEVNRIAKENALLTVWGYGVCNVDHEIDELFLDFYHNIVGPYWDEARRQVENEYRDIPFPFMQIETPKFFIQADWPLEAFLGYLSTWSATQKYIKMKGHNPVEQFFLGLKKFWEAGEVRRVTFPMFVKMGWVKKSP